MMFKSAVFLLAALSAPSTTCAFTTTSPSNRFSRSSLAVSLQSQDDSSSHKQQGSNPWASLAVAGTIFATTLAGSVAVPPPANADVYLSTGAIIINTSAKQGDSLLKAEVDVKDLFGSLIKNRKALKESVGRVAAVVKEELASPVWTELGKEVLQIEGDVTPEITLSPPRDVQQTVSDISKGRLNFIVNGEIINLSVDKTSSQGEDEIVIRAKGVRGVGLPQFNEPAVTQVRTRLQDQIEGVYDFWYSPLALPDAIKESLPEGVVIDNGSALVGGTVVGLGSVYGLSYGYYLNQQAEAAKKAEAQRQKVAERKAAAAAAAAKKAAEEAEESS
ncbi:expressed unknown protein [Seminavis robusta]|uniref:Uncharacterized protein n=1 Tax=Seminavis robusta TaxID=568900 RepID=A0A9N8ESH7_9STRA|nr:expressed unknown protein [Seminavis robusta]|eukprot:Sro1569_g283130.1 n/a (332) ;mRNA; r:7618-8613